MSYSHNLNHFTGKTKSGDPRKNRKRKARVKRQHKNKYEQLGQRR